MMTKLRYIFQHLILEHPSIRNNLYAIRKGGHFRLLSDNYAIELPTTSKRSTIFPPIF